MEELHELSFQLLQRVPLSFRRSLHNVIHWDSRLIGIKGARGTGKTTLLLQWLASLAIPSNQKIYLSLDDLFFTRHDLSTCIRHFYLQGGKVAVLDEVHKYPGWAREIKNLYDKFEDLQIVFTGSSILELTQMGGDLSRRAVIYELPGLSFREYLEFREGLILPVISVQDIIAGPEALPEELKGAIKPLGWFRNYLEGGYYPFALEEPATYQQRLRQMVRAVIEHDMAEIKGLDIRQAKKLLQLLGLIAEQVPFKPNLYKLAEKTNIHRNSINNYLYYLQEARLIGMLHPAGSSLAALQKPEKLYLDNPNLLYALATAPVSAGTLREVFFFSQVRVKHRLSQPKAVDFLVDEQYYIEVGGPHKKSRQLTSLPEAYLVKDDLMLPVGRNLPLWMFGFLY
jgi:predicted AAA+ superfamily ATPase